MYPAISSLEEQNKNVIVKIAQACKIEGQKNFSKFMMVSYEFGVLNAKLASILPY